MKDFSDLSSVNPKVSSSLTRTCEQEISIRNHLYIIFICINNTEQPHIEIQIEAKENGDQWKSTFDVPAIETMTEKTGSFKSFNVFVNMLENAIKQESSSVTIDLLTSDDFELIRQKQKKRKSTKRYLILIYNVEYDRIYYVLSLQYCGKTDSVHLIEQIQELTIENQLLKSQLLTDCESCHLQQPSFDLEKEDDNCCQQLLLYNSKIKDQQIEFLRQMIRTSENDLIKERVHLQKTKRKKDDRCKSFNNQIELLKISERQLKSKVTSLTNEVVLLKKKNYPSYNSQSKLTSLSRSTSDEQCRYRSASQTQRRLSSFDSHSRFNPTVYVHERNVKYREIERQKKKETRQRLSTSGHYSDSDISDDPLKTNAINSYITTSNRKRMENQSQASIDSDIECVSSPLHLHKSAWNNSTILLSPKQNENSVRVDNITDLDQRFKSLQKFLKQNFTY